MTNISRPTANAPSRRYLRAVIWQFNDGFAVVGVLRGPAFQQVGRRHQSEEIAREAAQFVRRKHPDIAFKDMRYPNVEDIANG
ncbi:MAG: hypothetical protein ABS75_07355 [Pelagibacterium sp. SCN 63-23]|nr:MAG: hypothetical protein ABS75_07355 [Pelagibacterium sp. SCN 63-23]